MAATGVAGGYQRRRFAGVKFATGPTPPLAAPTVWYDASQISGPADGTKISSWPDMSANKTDLAQATGANQPTYYKTTSAKLINGKPAVWFDGTASWMATGLFVLPQPLTVAAVAEVAAAPHQLILFSNNNTPNWPFAQYTTASGLFNISAGNTVNGGGPGIGAVQSVITAFSGAASYQQIGATLTSPLSGNPGTDGFVTSLEVGGVIGANNLWDGPVCELLIWPRALSAADVATVYGYFKTKWGVP